MGNSQSNKPLEQPREEFEPPKLIKEPSTEPLVLYEFKERIEKEILKSISSSSDPKMFIKTSQRPTKPAPQSVERVALAAQPNEETNEDIVNDHDGRMQIHATDKWPNSVHGVVACKINNVSKWGTGTMIGPNVVLTAGHNLYNYRKKISADVKSIQFLPGMNGQVLPFGPVEVAQCFISPNYIQEEKEDYAVLILKEPIGEMTGYFGLACLEPEELKKNRINVTGYPGDKVASKPNTYEMWGMEGIASHVDQDKGYINYLIDTTAGQSGSGVWYQEGENYYVCGIHIAGDWCVNRATLLTKNLYQQINDWLLQENSKELKELRLSLNKVNLDCVSLLLKFNFEDLRILVLTASKIGDEEAKALAKNTSWVSLSVLSLATNKIGAEGASALSKNKSWINLSELFLQGNSIGAEGAKALAQNPSWIKLQCLNLEGNGIGHEGAKKLAQNSSWINLSRVFLFYNCIGDEGAKELAKNTSWINLEQLKLEGNKIGNEGAKELARNTSWVKLKWLTLKGNNIGHEGAKGLAKNTSWIKLEQLNLEGNKIGNEGAKELARNTSWINLSTLYLSSFPGNTEGVEALRQNKVWKKFRVIGV